MASEERFRSLPEMRQRKLKQQAVEFYKKHDVTGALEKVLNKLFPDDPSDVFGYMVSMTSSMILILL